MSNSLFALIKDGALLHLEDSSVSEAEYALLVQYLRWIRKSRYSQFKAVRQKGEFVDVEISNTFRHQLD